jgi:hypothetical protein
VQIDERTSWGSYIKPAEVEVDVQPGIDDKVSSFPRTDASGARSHRKP